MQNRKRVKQIAQIRNCVQLPVDLCLAAEVKVQVKREHQLVSRPGGRSVIGYHFEPEGFQAPSHRPKATAELIPGEWFAVLILMGGAYKRLGIVETVVVPHEVLGLLGEPVAFKERWSSYGIELFDRSKDRIAASDGSGPWRHGRCSRPIL
jgi:hypothetical protein